jgi:hypothetical protein
MEVYRASAKSGRRQGYGFAGNAGILGLLAPGALKMVALPVKADAAQRNRY